MRSRSYCARRMRTSGRRRSQLAAQHGVQLGQRQKERRARVRRRVRARASAAMRRSASSRIRSSTRTTCARMRSRRRSWLRATDEQRTQRRARRQRQARELVRPRAARTASMRCCMRLRASGRAMRELHANGVEQQRRVFAPARLGDLGLAHAAMTDSARGTPSTASRAAPAGSACAPQLTGSPSATRCARRTRARTARRHAQDLARRDARSRRLRARTTDSRCSCRPPRP